MELVFLWVKNYKCIRNQEFNFSSEIRFHFDEEALVLTQTSHNSDFSGNQFFSIEGKDSNVKNVSVIVGQNGSGKSSIASVLFDVLNKGRFVESIIIFKEMNEYFLYNYLLPIEISKEEYKYLDTEKWNNIYTFENDRYIKRYETQGDLLELFLLSNIFKELERIKLPVFEYPDFIKLINHKSINDPSNNNHCLCKLIYYSSHYTSVYAIKSAEDKEDISTTSFIHRDNKESEFISNIPSYQVENQHVIKDYERTAKFLSFLYFHDQINEKIITFRAKFQRLLPRGFILKFVKDMKKYDFDSLNESAKLNYSIIEKLFRPAFINSDKDKLVLLLVNRYFSDLIFSDNIKSILNGSVLFTDKDVKFLRKENFLNRWKGFYDKIHDNSNLKILNFNYLILSLYKLNDDVFRQFKYETNIKTILDGTIYFDDLSTNEKLLQFLEIVDYYSKSIFKESYLTFNLTPKISSGEYSFLTIFSRLYNYFQNKNSLICTNITHLIFLDEIEVTQHPELQKSIVSLLLTFLSLFFSEKKFQLIFATHSPILLSDLPSSNAIFLEKDEIGFTRSVDPGISTFGANIHTLYRKSFFLKDGTMGMFAEKKINDLIKKINENVTLNSLDYYVLSQIGEPVLKRSLEQMIHLHESNENTDRINQLEKKVEELEKRLGEI